MAFKRTSKVVLSDGKVLELCFSIYAAQLLKEKFGVSLKQLLVGMRQAIIEDPTAGFAQYAVSAVLAMSTEMEEPPAEAYVRSLSMADMNLLFVGVNEALTLSFDGYISGKAQGEVAPPATEPEIPASGSVEQ